MGVFSFSIIDAIGYACRAFFKNVWIYSIPVILLGLFLELPRKVSLVLQLYYSEEIYSAWTESLWIVFGVYILGKLICFVISIIIASIGVNVFYNRTNATLLSSIPRFFTFFKIAVAYLIYDAAILIGMLFFIYPGIVIMLRLQFYQYFILEYDAGIIEAFKASWNITINDKLKLFLLRLGLFFLGTAVLMLNPYVTKYINFYVGFVTILISAATLISMEKLVSVHVYDQLKPDVIIDEEDEENGIET